MSSESEIMPTPIDHRPEVGQAEVVKTGLCTFLPSEKMNVATADVRWTLRRFSETVPIRSNVISPLFDVRCGEHASRWRVELYTGAAGVAIGLLNASVDSDGQPTEQAFHMQCSIDDGAVNCHTYGSAPLKISGGEAWLLADFVKRAVLLKNYVKDDQLVILVSVTVFHSHQQKDGQRSLLVRQPLPNLPLLDDPVLAGIKSQSVISSRVGLTPMNEKFANVAFLDKRRMEMNLQEFGVFIHDERNYMRLVVKEGNDSANECAVDIPMSDANMALRQLFLHIRHWNTIDIARQDFVIPETRGRHRWTGCQHCRLGNNANAIARLTVIRSQFLDAFFGATTETVNIRQFRCFDLDKATQEKLANFLQRCAPFLRSLTVGLRGEPLPSLVSAIGACQQLRKLVIGIYDPCEKFMASFCQTLPKLTQLNSLHLGAQQCLDHLTIDSGHITICHDWLPFIDHLAFRPLPKKIQHLSLELGFDGECETFPIDSLRSIIKMMHSPYPIIINHFFEAISLEDLCTDFLPLAFWTRATVHLLLHRSGLRRMTVEDIKGRNSPLSSTMRNALILPELKNVKLDADKCYGQLEFSFAKGGKLIVKKSD